MAKILIIEDDRAISDIERDYLELSDFETDVAYDGVDWLNKALSGGFDLILLDLMLPGLDGFTICKKLREKLDIPILMVTARTQDIDKIRGLGFGADDYVEKPFSPSVLVARVKANLAQYERLRPTAKPVDSIISVGPFVMDSDARTASIDGRELKLKNKEFELLRTFMTNPGRAFTREQLLSSVWCEDFMGETRTVDVHVGTLRQKLGSCGKYIRTVRGVGYRLEV